MTDTSASGLSLLGISKIKAKFSKLRDKLYKIYYYDADMNGYEIDGLFRRMFKNISPNEIH